MRSTGAGRLPKYHFLIDRLNDEILYCAATIARLLTKEDLRRQKNIQGTLKHARFNARQSLAHFARSQNVPPCGLVYLGKGQTGNAYPGYRGKVWKTMCS